MSPAPRRGRAAIGTMVDVPAGRIHVREDGPADAPALVLLHGWTCSVHWFDLLTPLLSEDFRVIRPDLLGYGCSPRGGGRFDTATQTTMVSSVLDELGVDAFVPLGHSFGAEVAIGLAERTGRATGVVVVGQAADYSTATFPRGHDLLARLPLSQAFRFVAGTLVPSRSGGVGFAPGFRPDRAFPNPAQVRADLRSSDPRTFRAVIVDRARDLAERPLDVRLRELGLPSLVVLGARDRLYPVAPTRARYDAVPNVTVEVIEESGHSPMVERPEQVARILRAFLAPARPAEHQGDSA